MSKSGQKFIARNRAPRVQIEYDVELYGTEKKVQLPFVMGVMSDLSGASAEPLPAVGDRKFLEIDVDNFDERMKAIRPRAAFKVPNTLTGDGNLSVDLTFERMEDFSPAAIAQKVEPLHKLLEARTRLSHLTTYMDGKTGAEDLIAKLIADPAALSALIAGVGSQTGSNAGQESALESLRAAAPDEFAPSETDTSNSALNALRNLPTQAPEDDTDGTTSILESLRAAAPAENPSSNDDHSQTVLDTLRNMPVDQNEETDDTDAAFEELREASALIEDEACTEEPDDLTAFFADTTQEDSETELNDIIGDDAAFDADDALAEAEDDVELSLDEDDVLEDVDLTSKESGDDDLTFDDETEDGSDDDLDLDDLLNDDETSEEDDSLALADNDEELSLDDDEGFDLDALLADDGNDEDDLSNFGSADDALDDATSDDFDLDTLLDDEASEPDDLESDDAPAIADPFGTISLERPADIDQTRPKFRIAILSDFSGRASRGDLEIGDGLANRKPIKLDVDNIHAVIARFATTLVLPLGNDGAGIEVKLNSLDDLHPDELYENVALFEELSVLRQSVARGDTAAISALQHAVGEAGDTANIARKRAKGSAVPADRKLSDFRSLIGDMQGKLAKPSPANELIGRIVAPYVKAAPDPAQSSILAAIDEALSGAMRTILHHPDFQAVESTWRSLDFLARRIETGANLEIVLYDVSAEEWAADLAAQDDLAESGLFKMLAEEPRLDEAQGALSAVFGLFTLEETPPHAELLARMSKIAAWMNAPFMTAISPVFLETPKEDRHPLTAKTWDALRALPEAAFIGLVAPRFLLRLPYGKRTEPVDPFDFEEFTLRSGLKGMLWANPVILSATLMAETVNRMGKNMRLGEIMSLGDIPVHTMVDQYGDQVALPCTERLLNTRTMADVVTRGFMPLLSIKGRNEVRQGSFQALGGDMLSGPWALAARKGTVASGTSVAFGAAPGTAGNKKSTAAPTAEADTNDDGDELDLDLGGGDEMPDFGSSDNDDSDLDALLAGFGDNENKEDGSDDEEMDPDLAALLEGP